MQQTQILCRSLLAAYKQINQDTCSTEIRHHHELSQPLYASSVRLLQLFASYFLKVTLVYILISSSPPAMRSTLLLSFCLLHVRCITSVFLLLFLLCSDYLFVGCNLRQVLLSCSQVLVLSLCFQT